MNQTNKLKDSVDQKTQMAGENRMQLLIFNLGPQGQSFGINVFKVREVIPCPDITPVPKTNQNVIGMASIRSEAIPVIDMAFAIGLESAPRGPDHPDFPKHIIITEYNRKTQAFLIEGIDRIVNQSWENIEAPPSQIEGGGNYLTAITQIEKEIISIIDVEQVLSETSPEKEEKTSNGVIKKDDLKNLENHNFMVIDDSSVARRQLIKCLDSIDAQCEVYENGQQGLDQIKKLIESGTNLENQYAGIICDIEMPVMDGYSFTTQVKQIREADNIPVILHSSLSGVFNEALVEKVGADAFVAKFDPDELVEKVIELKSKEVTG